MSLFVKYEPGQSWQYIGEVVHISVQKVPFPFASALLLTLLIFMVAIVTG
jgi:ABC-type microcin C transport system permease subunit YejB